MSIMYKKSNNTTSNTSEYFDYFEKLSNELNKINKYIIAEEISNICHKIKKRIEDTSNQNFFDVMAEILGLDSQLQIITMLLSHFDDEYEIIELAKKDYEVYFKEMIVTNETNMAPTLHLLVK